MIQQTLLQSSLTLCHNLLNGFTRIHFIVTSKARIVGSTSFPRGFCKANCKDVYTLELRAVKNSMLITMLKLMTMLFTESLLVIIAHNRSIQT